MLNGARFVATLVVSVLLAAGPVHAALDSPRSSPLWGTVISDDAVIRQSPEPSAPLQVELLRGRGLAFRNDPALLARGWLEREQGGFVEASMIELHSQKQVYGVPDPTQAWAFLWRDGMMETPQGARPVHRFERFPVQSIQTYTVETPAGVLRRADVRVAEATPRPPHVSSTAKWVHVELSEQVLTAYEGDRWVFATLVSTGKEGFDSDDGLFKVWKRLPATKMAGGLAGDDDWYDFEGVPYALFYNGGEALHGAFWTPPFGRPSTHGCVNLSVADAAWLYEWTGAQHREGAGHGPLWVKVER